MKLTQTTKKLIAYSIPFLIVGGMTVKPLMTSVAGEEIQLATTPIDPRDLFRGDHVLLSLEIEQVPLDIVSDGVKENLPLDDNYNDISYKSFDVYVRLGEKKGVYKATQVVIEKPTSGVFIKGSVDPWMTSEKDKTIQVTYDLDRYFVPENTGMALEEGAREGKAIVSLKVREGHAVIKEVHIQED